MKIMLQIAVVFVSDTPTDKDKLAWGSEAEGVFTVRSAYSLLTISE